MKYDKEAKNVTEWVNSRDVPYKPVDHKPLDSSEQGFKHWVKEMADRALERLHMQTRVDFAALRELGLPTGANKAEIELGLNDDSTPDSENASMLKN